MSKNNPLKMNIETRLSDLEPGIQDVLKIAHQADPGATERALNQAGAWAISRELKLDGQIRNQGPERRQLSFDALQQFDRG